MSRRKITQVVEVTDLGDLQEQLQDAKNAMEEATQAKEDADLAYNLAHENMNDAVNAFQIGVDTFTTSIGL